MSQAQSTTLAALKNPPAPVQPPVEIVRAGFDTADGFALMQRGANLLANSTIVPAQYRTLNVKKDQYGNITKEEENPSAISNCVVALNMAQRMGADPLMIMQNLYIVEGRPAWSSQYIIASVNACGKYSPLRFKLEDLGEKEVEYSVTKWVNKQRIVSTEKAVIHDMRCIAWALEKKTGEVLESPPVTIELAVKEGWYGKNGSKWQTMPEVMLRYRAASFFGKLYAPELLMGIQTAEEVHDSTYDMELTPGGYQVTTAEIRRPEEVNPQTGEVTEPQAAEPDQKPEPEAQAAPEKKRAPAAATKNTATPAPTGQASPTAQTVSSAAEAAPAGKQPQNRPADDSGQDPFDGGYLITCPDNGKQVDELDCQSKPCRNGCPAFLE